MSRYLLLVLLNLPLIIAAIAGLVIKLKLKKITVKRFVLHAALWLLILLGLIFAQPIYEYLFNNQLTKTEPLSLFDVVQLTATITIIYFLAKSRSKQEILERRMNDLHQEISIQLSNKK